jgi:3-(3-hydroxy-phenyl)propionate hydroxylase
VFEDNFLIADVTMEAEFPTERWFWFDPPFNKGQSALLHKQPDGVWRIDLQLGWDVDKEEEKKPENVIPRLKAMLGEDVEFDLEWVSIYTFQCRRMERFLHNRVIFAGDSAHQVSPFGARGANSGIQDVDNLCWKLAEVIQGHAPESLLESYNSERVFAADENILNSTRSTDFITPKSDVSRLFRDAVLELSEHHAFARPLVNSGRLSLPSSYRPSTYFCADVDGLPDKSRPGAPCPDAQLEDGRFLLQTLSAGFNLVTFNLSADRITLDSDTPLDLIAFETAHDKNQTLHERYLGAQKSAIYLIRPDQYIAARWTEFDAKAIKSAISAALGHTA